MLASALIFSVPAVFCELHLAAVIVSFIASCRQIVTPNAAQQIPRELLLARHLVIASFLGLLGFAAWAVDFFLCASVVRALPVNPQLHAWWHVLTALALHEALFVCTCVRILLGGSPRLNDIPQMVGTASEVASVQTTTLLGLGFIRSVKNPKELA